MSRRPKGLEARLAYLAGGVAAGFEEFAGIEFAFVFDGEAADGAAHGQTQVGVDVDLAHAALDAFDDGFDGHAVGLADFTAVFAEDGEPFLRNAGGAVHDQVGVGDALVDGADAVDGEDVAGGRAGEFVGAVAGADGDGEGVDAGGGDEVGGLGGVGEELVGGEHAVGADAVFFAGLAGFKRAEAAQFAFDADADGVGHFDHLLRHFDVIGIAGRGFHVVAQRAVHHHAGEA